VGIGTKTGVRLRARPHRALLGQLPLWLCFAWLGTAIQFPGAQAQARSSTQIGDLEAAKAQADAARQQGDIALAVQLYTKAVTIDPAWADGWWFIGTMDYGNDQYSAARDALTHFIDLNPQAGPALALRGLCEFELGQYAESLQDLQQGIALGAANQPRNAHIVLYHEALALSRLGRYEEALGKYKTFAKDGAGNPELALAVGLAGLRMPLLPKDVAPDQTAFIAAVGQAAVTYMSGDTAGGSSAFQTLFQNDPKERNLHYLLGYLLLPTDPDAASLEFAQETKIAPDNPVAQAMLAWSLEFQGDFADSLAPARKAAADDPTLSMAQLVYARALVETGDTPAGLPLLENLLSGDPQNLEAHMTLAKAYSKLGRAEDARRERLLCLSIADQGTPSHANP